MLMARREKEDSNRVSVKDSSFSLLKLISVLISFVTGVVIGLASSSHFDLYFLYKGKDFYTVQFSEENSKFSVNCQGEYFSLKGFISPKHLNHKMTDDELFWRASLVPQKEDFPFKKVPRVAFMFLTRGPLPLLPLWEKFFHGQDSQKYSIYVHALPGYELNISTSSVFFRRQIPSQRVEWGSVSLVDAEKRLLANALLDYSNERFVLLSESCIPLYNFQTVYKYLIGSMHSFVESYDDPSRQGRGRYNSWMEPHIHLSEWRKGSQWFELHRTLAIKIIADTKYYNLFRRYCRPSCYPDEHYLPTFFEKFYGALNANRTITYVDWSVFGPHPVTFTAANVTEGFIGRLRNNGTRCSYNTGATTVCYLFARKFDPSALSPLLEMTSKVMGY